MHNSSLVFIFTSSSKTSRASPHFHELVKNHKMASILAPHMRSINSAH